MVRQKSEYGVQFNRRHPMNLRQQIWRDTTSARLQTTARCKANHFWEYQMHEDDNGAEEDDDDDARPLPTNKVKQQKRSPAEYCKTAAGMSSSDAQRNSRDIAVYTPARFTYETRNIKPLRNVKRRQLDKKQHNQLAGGGVPKVVKRSVRGVYSKPKGNEGQNETVSLHKSTKKGKDSQYNERQSSPNRGIVLRVTQRSLQNATVQPSSLRFNNIDNNDDRSTTLSHNGKQKHSVRRDSVNSVTFKQLKDRESAQSLTPEYRKRNAVLHTLYINHGDRAGSTSLENVTDEPDSLSESLGRKRIFEPNRFSERSHTKLPPKNETRQRNSLVKFKDEKQDDNESFAVKTKQKKQGSRKRHNIPRGNRKSVERDSKETAVQTSLVEFDRRDREMNSTLCDVKNEFLSDDKRPPQSRRPRTTAASAYETSNVAREKARPDRETSSSDDQEAKDVSDAETKVSSAHRSNKWISEYRNQFTYKQTPRRSTVKFKQEIWF